MVATLSWTVFEAAERRPCPLSRRIRYLAASGGSLLSLFWCIAKAGQSGRRDAHADSGTRGVHTARGRFCTVSTLYTTNDIAALAEKHYNE